MHLEALKFKTFNSHQELTVCGTLNNTTNVLEVFSDNSFSESTDVLRS